MFQKLDEIFQPLMGDLWRYVLPAAVAVIVLWIVWRLLRREGGWWPFRWRDLKVDVSTLGEAGPPEGLPALEFDNLPMRLAAIVFAPVGRSRTAAGRRASAMDRRDRAGFGQSGRIAFPVDPPLAGPGRASGFAHLFFSNSRSPARGQGDALVVCGRRVQNEGPARDGRPDLRRPAKQPRPDDHRRGAQVAGLPEGEVELV